MIFIVLLGIVELGWKVFFMFINLDCIFNVVFSGDKVVVILLKFDEI